MADFRNSEKVKNRRLMSFLRSRGLMAFACVCMYQTRMMKKMFTHLLVTFFPSRATHLTVINLTRFSFQHCKYFAYKVCRCLLPIQYPCLFEQRLFQWKKSGYFSHNQGFCLTSRHSSEERQYALIDPGPSQTARLVVCTGCNKKNGPPRLD